MSRLKKILSPGAYSRFIARRLHEYRCRLNPNLRGATLFVPGHFYSPLLDIRSLGPDQGGLEFDGPECWEHIQLRPVQQRSYYRDLIEGFPPLPFPRQRASPYRYFTENDWFRFADAFTLSGIIRREKPRRIIEVGSGFSSAVMLDTLRQTNVPANLTLIEPLPDRLDVLLTTADRSCLRILGQQVQNVPLSMFDELEAQDVLFIDSSHVAKIGSDVTFLILRVLPRLKNGVFVHFHDVFYPFSYPAEWLRQGRAWNESIFLRAFLVENQKFEITAFNAFAGITFPEAFKERIPGFLANTGGSLWLKKVL